MSTLSMPSMPALQLLPEHLVSTGFHLPKGRLTAILPVAAAAAAAFGAYLLCKSTGGKNGRVNKTIDKDSPKVVHSFDVEDIGSKAAYCRCWRSKKFPYCDGSHGKHNQETGDNVGPLIIKRRDV
ncbi:CDGSH iron-sulfur domain-containing protein 1-like [Anguilla anguilla]|uniref:CDGSH iron-sulfur domain-containing protein 1-like n=1 Tax=Anguilla anguilla TaxID=7936 RepID=UPI0015AE408A|nr:CDGSH iron-sulfur domain-containing protein 1-like [Anguilla anguilla]